MDDPTRQPASSHATPPCQFIGGPYDGRTIAVHDHIDTVKTETLDVDPGLRWIPELGGRLIEDPNADHAGLKVTPRTIRYVRHPGNRFHLEQP